MADSIFTKIIKGELPCHKVYEDDQTIAFLDINPVTPGHTLVVPKTQTAHLWDLTDDDYHYLMSVAKFVASHIKETLKVTRVAMLVDGYNMPDHAHIHLIPGEKGIEHILTEHATKPQIEPDHASLAKIATQLTL